MWGEDQKKGLHFWYPEISAGSIGLVNYKSFFTAGLEMKSKKKGSALRGYSNLREFGKNRWPKRISSHPTLGRGPLVENHGTRAANLYFDYINPSNVKRERSLRMPFLSKKPWLFCDYSIRNLYDIHCHCESLCKFFTKFSKKLFNSLLWSFGTMFRIQLFQNFKSVN